MASFKTILFVSLLIAAIAVPIAEAQLGLLSGLLGLIRIQGILFCTMNGTSTNASTPVFPNALVQLQCGSGNVVSTATTNASGAFSILLDPVQFLLSSVLNGCNLRVNTPLASCNAALPSVGGLLSGPLQLVGTTVQGLLSIVNIIPGGFQFLPNLN